MISPSVNVSKRKRLATWTPHRDRDIRVAMTRSARHQEGVADAKESRNSCEPLVGGGALLPVSAWAQSFNGSISGTVKDPSGATVSGAELVLKNQAGGIELKRTSQEKGEYAFRNLVPGHLRAPGERGRVQAAGSEEHRGEPERRRAGRSEPRPRRDRPKQVEVVAETSTMSYDSGAHEDGIAPDTLQQLPIAFGTGPRAAASMVLLDARVSPAAARATHSTPASTGAWRPATRPWSTA